MYAALLVDDLAADRQLAARVLKRAGWQVLVARNSREAQALLPQLLQFTEGTTRIILTDLNMPEAPPMIELPGSSGAQLALVLRTQMEGGTLPRLPILALTALTEQESHMTALAFGCDAILTKPVTPDLAQRIIDAMIQMQSEEYDIVGAGPMLRLLRHHLATQMTSVPPPPLLTENDVTKALLSYARQGSIGLGQTRLAEVIAPARLDPVQRGEYVYAHLIRCLQRVMAMNIPESLAVLQGELIDQASIADQCAALAISRSEYYRRRKEAISVLLTLVTELSS